MFECILLPSASAVSGTYGQTLSLMTGLLSQHNTYDLVNYVE